MAISKKVTDRLQTGLKQYCPILQGLRDRDVSEADTVTVVKDILNDVFGYDKYTEVTGEHAIRGTFCDLAIKLDGKLVTLIEVKAIGSDLNDRHVKQTIDYASNQGVDWVILTNGADWVLYHVLFKKPIDKEEVARINLLTANPRSEADLEKLFLLTKEGVLKDALTEYRDRKDATSHYMLAAIILNSDAIMSAIRKEVRQMSDIVVDKGAIEKVLREQVIKREALEGEQAQEAQRRFLKKLAKSKRQHAKLSAIPLADGLNGQDVTDQLDPCDESASENAAVTKNDAASDPS
jgi:predicted type IV restriction endonuclease